MIRLASLLILVGGILLIVALSGCTHTYKGSGLPAPAPGGFEQLCRDMPDFPSCKPAKN